MSNLIRLALLVVFITASSQVQAVETIIINGTVGDGDFEFPEDPNNPGLVTGAVPFTGHPNWFHANNTGPNETIPFSQDSQTNGSSQPGSRAGMPFQNRVQINNTAYTITEAGVPFNISYDFGAGGNAANWTGDEVMRTFLFESSTPVDPNTIVGDITELGADLYNIDRANDPQWTTRSTDAFYTSTVGDIGKTVYFGMEFQDPAGPLLFPRIDVVRFTAGTPEIYDLEFNAALNPADGTTAWQPNVDQGPQPGGQPTEFFTFAAAESFATVNDPSVPGITGSYSAGGVGRLPAPSEGAAGQVDSSFEVWFKPNSLLDGEQVIADFGGLSNGSYISLDDNILSFYTTSGGASGTVSTTLSSDDWTQVVANWTPTGDLELFVNGQSVDTASGTAFNRFGGGNQWGLGQVGGDPNDGLAIGGPVTTDPNNISDVDFAGEIGLFRYYPIALSGSQVLDSYDAIAAAGIAGDFDGSGVVDGLDFLLWQTDPNVGDLADWENNYGTGGLSANVSAVPEPGSLMLFACTAISVALRRKRGLTYCLK